jgi:hypothetical protein
MTGPDRPPRSRPARDRAQSARTGARTAPDRPRRVAEPPAGEKGGGGQKAATTYRGVRWERNSAGRLRWHNDDGDRWVLWRPGQDAPPRPPQWVSDPEPLGPLLNRRARKGWRSPYRLLPVVLIVAVTIIAIIQASGGSAPGSSSVASEKAAAEKLLDKCLVAQGTSGGQLRIESQPVPCSSPQASVRVVQVLPGTPGSPSCPAGTSTVRLAYPGVAHPHQLCVKHLGA